MPSTWFLSLALAALTLPVLLPPQQTVFRGGTQTVSIFATVLDGKGRLVADLEKQHFEVLDDGKAQELTVFKSDVQPVTVALMLDTSGSMTNYIELLKQAAEQFVIRIMPEDRVRIGSFADRVMMTSPKFSGDRDELIRILHTDIQFGNGTHLWEAIGDAMESLKDATGRRVVLVFTDGADDKSRRIKFDDLIEQTQNTEIMIYAIGLKNYMGNGTWTRPDDELKRLSQQTGGGYFELTQATELSSTFTRIADELHRQYVLGFRQTSFDGKTHLLDVRVKVDGMTARARKSYIAAKAP